MTRHSRTGVADEGDEGFRQMLKAGILTAQPYMKNVSAAAMTLVAGRPGREMRAPEPMVQAGFEHTEESMSLLVNTAQSQQRDLIHVSCHRDGHGGPTGMIAVVYFEKGVAIPHRRCGLVCRPGDTRVVLAGVSDEKDEQVHFVFSPERKMVRRPGWVVDDLGDGIHRAGEFWIELAKSGRLGDCTGEMLGLYTLSSVDGGPPRVF